MRKLFPAVAGILASTLALGAEARYQIELIPKGKIVAQDAPTLKGTNYLFHQYPTGALISIKKSTVKQISKLSPEAAEAVSPTRIVPIRDLAFQGPKSGPSSGRRTTNIDRARSAASAANAGTAGRTASPD